MATQTGPSAGRIVSMDQFRGYTVAGMCVVNFVGGLAAVHPVFKHNNNYFSYADTIMPSFLFICGMSYRLTVLRRLEQVGPAAMRRRVVARSFGLVLLSLMLFGFGMGFKHWSEVTPPRVWEFFARLVKANLWEVLSIIGMAQLLVLPVIASSRAVRAATVAGFMALHVVISYLFNWNFVYGLPNALDPYWGVAGSTAWDGGVFGLLSWGAILLAGTLAYDIVSTRAPGRSAARLLGSGVVLMGLGYGLSCLSTLYDGEAPTGQRDTAASPVLPPLAKLSGSDWHRWAAEPPFVRPPKERPNNYWMMNKRIVSLPFVAFSTGFASALYGLFVLACDPRGRGLGVFRTFGQNALAAYALHHMVEEQIRTVVPGDSPLWWCLVGLTVFFAITYLFVRYLEKQGIHIRL
jgi:predicted acyltransferase